MSLYPRIWFFFLCLVFNFSARAQVVAGFTAVPSSGCAPLAVSFTNTSTPIAGTTYAWNLGNGGGTITLTSPGTNYLAPGTYTVTLTATNGGASNTHTEIINVYPQPTVSFTVSDTESCRGTPLVFFSTSTAGMPGALRYLWAFGDGYTDSISPATHAYGLPGRFNVSLTATNAAGCSSTLTQPSLEHVYGPPVASFSSATRHICHHSGTASFTSSPTGTAPFAYRWDFGDGSSPSASANPTHFYAAPGRYTVKLVVTDAHGCMDSVTQPSYINVSALTAAFTVPATACRGTTVTFPNTSSNYLSSRWFYGNGNSGTTTNGSSVYPNFGRDTVMLVVADSFCTDTAIHTVNFPASSFHVSPDSPCPAPITVTVNATAPVGSTITWDMGDGGAASGYSFTHLYTAGNGFTQKMFVTTPAGCRDTFSSEYDIQPFDIILAQQPAPPGGCVPFRYTIGPPLPPIMTPPPYAYPFKYAINFGDGSRIDTLPIGSNITNLPTTAHVFTAQGTYPVKLTLISVNGCVGIAYDTTHVGIPKQATFTATPRHLCYNNNLVTFRRTLVSDTADEYRWLFGDGSSPFSTAPGRVFDTLHHFTDPDSAFSVALVTFYHGCPDTFWQRNYIRIDSPKAIGFRAVYCPLPRTVSFKSLSEGADSVRWLLGDGSTSNLDSFNHAFPSNGVFSSTLIAYNTRAGCSDTEQLVPVNLDVPVVAITASDTAICNGNFALLSAKAVTGEVSAYQWFIGGHLNNIISFDGTQVADTFYVPGRYTLRLVVTDKNTACTDTVTKINYILVAQPVSHVSVTPPALCYKQSAAFTDSSTDQPGISIINHSWTFGDGGAIATPGPSVAHTYSVPGNYTVTETVKDNLGCISVPTVTVSVYGTTSSFTAPTNACGGTGILFTNTSPAASYLWLFGDGSTSTIANPVHALPDTGSYTVRLVATDVHGCHDTSARTIVVTRPHASFTMNDSVGVCPPLVVTFTNTSIRGNPSFWNLGNGTSIATNPVASYTVGLDTIFLVAVDSFGCHDTSAPRHAKVYGYTGDFTYNVDSGCVPLRVTFNAQLSDTMVAASMIWAFGDGVLSAPTLSNTITHNYLSPGPYMPTLVITDHSGCVSSSAGRDTIKVDSVKAGFMLSANSICIHNRVRFTDTSHSYWSRVNRWRWTINGAVASTDTTSAVFAAAGIYPIVLHATDAWGCSADDTQSVSVYALPAIVPVPDAMLCVGQSISLQDSTAGGTWLSGAPATASVGSASGIVAGVDAGVSNITYAAAGNCYTTITVTVNARPDSGVISGDSALCLGASAQLSESISGGVWSVANANDVISSSGMLTSLLVGLDTVRYTVSNANCSSVALRPVIVFQLPDAGTISGKDTLCRDASVTLTETKAGGHWYSGDSIVAVVDSGGHTRGLSAGSATVTFITSPDSNGCSNSTTFPIFVINTDMSVTSTVTGVKCYDDHNGSIEVHIGSGTPPYIMVWSTNDTTSSIDSLPAGAYSLTITEPAKGCTLVQSFNVPSPDSFYVNAEISKDVCDRPNGSIRLNPSGGTAPYHFLWSNKQITPELTALPSGVYSCTVTDVNRCVTYFSTPLIDSTCRDIIIHEGISPNGDGINDTWVIEGLWRYPDNDVKIFDKWGNEVFEEANYKNDWNGAGSKGPVPDGTYYYMVKLNTEMPPNGKSVYTGPILLKR